MTLFYLLLAAIIVYSGVRLCCYLDGLPEDRSSEIITLGLVTAVLTIYFLVCSIMNGAENKAAKDRALAKADAAVVVATPTPIPPKICNCTK